jgi:hypothetical protein
MIETIFAFFALSWVPWGLSAVLVVGALLIWLDFRRRLRPVLAGLDEALAIIEEAATPAAFRDRFPSINEALAGNAIIGEAWRSFAQTLVPVPGQDKVLGATRRPADDLNEAILASAGLNLRFYMAVPNYLVGLGLLFTFLGLVAALYFASAGVTAANVQEAQGALRDLLSAATFKFVTSIAGLGASIAYSLREKDQLYRVSRHLARLCASLEARLVPVSPEYLGLMQLDELRSQNAIMRRIGRNLYVTVPDTVEERIATELLDAVQPMRAGFVRAAAQLAKLDERLAERLIGPTATVAPGSTAVGEHAGLAPLLEELRRLREAVEALPPSALPAAREASGDSRLVRALPSFVRLFELSTEGLRSLDLRLEHALARIKTALDSLQAERATPAAAGVALDRLRTSLRALAEMRRELDDLGRAFRDVAGTSRAILAAQHAQNATDDPELAAALEQLSRNVERFNERVRAFVVHADQELARSSRMLTGVAGDLAQEPR